jgi:hypothetical protein
MEFLIAALPIRNGETYEIFMQPKINPASLEKALETTGW